MTVKLHAGRARLVLACAFALSAAACGRNGDQTASNTAANGAPLAPLPLTTADTGPVTLAPALAALPPAPPVRLRRLADPRQGYAYLDRAYASAQAYGDAPPDYSYDYDGVRPWVWRGDDGAQRVAEQTPAGLRYYYYEPGSQYPYLVQDSDYTYGYSDGQLATVYRDGALLSFEDAQRRADIAGRYLARANALYAASQNQQRLAVAQARWEAERAQIAANRARWSQEQSEYAAWQAFHAAHVQAYQDHYAVEQYRRDGEAVRFAQSVNDQAGAAQALQAAQQAQLAAHRIGQDVAPPAPLPGPAIPPSAPQFGDVRPDRFGQRLQPQPQGVGQPPGEAARQAAQAEQARAQADADRRASAQAAANAQAQQAARLRAQQDAAQQGQARAQAAAQQAEASRTAQAAQANAQRAATRQAQGEAMAAREAARQSEAAARQAQQAQQAAARQAQAQAQTQVQANAARDAARRSQAAAQAQQAAHQAEAAAARAQAAAHATPPAHPAAPHPASSDKPRAHDDNHPKP